MSTTRLAFLYPHLWRSLRIVEPVAKTTRLRVHTSHPQCMSSRAFTTSITRRIPKVTRHGKAVEPALNDEGEAEGGAKVSTVDAESKDDEKSKESKENKKTLEAAEAKLKEEESSSSAPLSDETQAAARTPGDDGPQVEESETKDSTSLLQQATANTADPAAPLETILQMPPPESAEEENASKPPHLQTPPYVHHFDTYTLVQQVEAGGFTMDQSITSMKAVRGLLAQNLDVAKAGLVSKSGVENETYLFRAACSELKTEIQNSRNKSEETMRRERTHLQHEVDTLNQKLTQELLTLRDDLKGMFDDRKMSVRGEQRQMDSKIQELNYKITVMLNSDAKSDIEGLRWVLTRRSVMAILVMAFMVLTSLRYAKYKAHEEEVALKREAGMKVDEQIEDLPSAGAAEILAAN